MSSYSPTYPGGQITEQWIMDELSRIAVAIAQPTSLLFDETFAAPTTPKEGLTLFADGTAWNPGSGRGVYVYSGGAWTKF